MGCFTSLSSFCFAKRLPGDGCSSLGNALRKAGANCAASLTSQTSSKASFSSTASSLQTRIRPPHEERLDTRFDNSSGAYHKTAPPVPWPLYQAENDARAENSLGSVSLTAGWVVQCPQNGIHVFRTHKYRATTDSAHNTKVRKF